MLNWPVTTADGRNGRAHPLTPSCCPLNPQRRRAQCAARTQRGSEGGRCPDYRPSHGGARCGQAIFFFENGALGFTHFTSLTFGSPLRGISSTEFYGEEGMAVGEELFVLGDDGARRPVGIKRVTCRAGGVEVLDRLVADTQPEIAWANPFRSYPIADGSIAIACR